MRIDVAGVVGLGTMGAGIAEVLARAGSTVVAVEIDEAALAAGRGRLSGSVRRAVDRGRLEEKDADKITSRVTFSTQRSDLAAAQLVVEAVPERLAVKAELFAELDRLCAAETILATNTSSLPVTAIAATTGRPDRVVGMHFFNPAPAMRLVEVVETVVADADAVNSVVDLARECGKTPVVAGDRAGFIANALLLPYLNDAARLVETGRCGIAALDTAVVARTGLPMGPLTLMDLIGLDVCVPILDVLWEEFRDPRYAATPLLRRLATAGRLGRKTGVGWYRYDDDGPRPALDRGGAGDDSGEAAGLLHRHVADGVRMRDDGYATEADIDTAMRLGCGYPEGLFALNVAGTRVDHRR